MQHYAWAGGHVLFLLTAVRYLVAWATFSSAYYSRWYHAAYLCALVSYSIVCYKSLGQPVPDASYVTRLLTDENSQYLLLAAAWWFSKPVPLSLLPFTIFSLFHTLTFVRTTIIPQLLQAPPPPGQTPAQHPFSKTIQIWVKANYDKAMNVVAYIEVAILARLFLGLIIRQSSILSLVVYIHFIRMRYLQSLYTREAFAYITRRIDAQLASAPPQVKQAWGIIQQGCSFLVTRNVIQPAQAQGSAARRSQ
ncbi:hypothetical protein AURDEDRAFT_78311 [Auricularia subglabra TFB-10046 SS5]|nr:hypothetical protein AURDEDRAFT_78311 [Auricularia subglabra TFB-10046 SS5]